MALSQNSRVAAILVHEFGGICLCIDRREDQRTSSGPTGSVAATACARGDLGERPASSRTAQACCSTGQLGRISAHPLTVPPRGHDQWPLGRRTVLAQLALALRRAR